MQSKANDVTAANKKIHIELIREALEDYKKLDGSVRKDVAKKIDKLADNPFAGDSLGNKDNIDLTGYYKLYACDKKIRIVYRLITPERVEIIEIWGIGKRDTMAIYKTIGKRIKNHIEKPQT